MAATKKSSSTSSSNDSPNKTGEEAFADPKTNPDFNRGQVVGEPVTSSFDERTGVTQPFLRADGSQDNGAPDLTEPEGARRETTREGDNTTVEDTNTAIEEGTISGNQRIGSEEAFEAPKNPVATSSETGAPDNVDTQVTGSNAKPASKSKTAKTRTNSDR